MDELLNWIRRLFRGDVVAIGVLAEWVIIGTGVYVILRFLRGTRGANLFRGMALLLLLVTVVVKLVADRFNLDRIQAAYPTFVMGVILVGIVVFQPELRRALMHLGATGWLPGFSRDVVAMLDELIESVSYLSRNKVGALMAIERNTELGGLIASGCKLDAEVTAQLLNTIFWPGSALHDMGAVISQGRLAAAAVQFPLTDNESLDPSLGSRHRAALGLSEESDALIVVVSEETGIISLAEHGHLHRPLTPDTLRSLLEARLGGGTPSEPALEPTPAAGETAPSTPDARTSIHTAT